MLGLVLKLGARGVHRRHRISAGRKTIKRQGTGRRFTRDEANTVVLDVVHSDGGWHLTIGDANTGPSRGHMLSVPAGGSILEAAMEVSVGTAGPHDLSAAAPVRL